MNSTFTRLSYFNKVIHTPKSQARNFYGKFHEGLKSFWTSSHCLPLEAIWALRYMCCRLRHILL